MSLLKKIIYNCGVTHRKFATSDVVGKLLAGKAKLLWETIQYREQYTTKIHVKIQKRESVNHKWSHKKKWFMWRKWEKKITNLFRSPRWSWKITNEEKKYILENLPKQAFTYTLEETKMQLVVESICDNNIKKEKF